MKVRRLLLALSFALYFVPVSAVHAQVAECVPTLPHVVSRGGAVAGASETIEAKDASPLTLGVAGKAGWVVLDLGCFTDHAGADIDIYEVGKAAGGEVYVAGDGVVTQVSPNSVGNPGRGWTRIKESVPPHYAGRDCSRSEYNCTPEQITSAATYQPFSCDGSETLPVAAVGCLSGDQWFHLNIGTDDVGEYRYVDEYRYVYIWSNGDSDIDTVLATAPNYSVDLVVVAADGSPVQFLNGVRPSTVLTFNAATRGDGSKEEETYDFFCNDSNTPSASGDLHDGKVGNLSCQYNFEGVYQARIKVDGNTTVAEDTLRVSVGPSGESGGASPIKSGWVTLLVVLAFVGAVSLFLHFRKHHEPTTYEE